MEIVNQSLTLLTQPGGECEGNSDLLAVEGSILYVEGNVTALQVS
jgi:hypothetical protein